MSFNDIKIKSMNDVFQYEREEICAIKLYIST